MEAGAVNEAQDRLVEIYNNLKAEAGGVSHDGHGDAAGLGRRPERAATPAASPEVAEVRARDAVVGLVRRLLRRPAARHRLVQLRVQAAGDGAAGPIGTDQLSLDNYREALNDTFFDDVPAAPCGSPITGTLLCLLIGFPVAYFIAVKVPPKWRGVAARLW